MALLRAFDMLEVLHKLVARTYCTDLRGLEVLRRLEVFASFSVFIVDGMLWDHSGMW